MPDEKEEFTKAVEQHAARILDSRNGGKVVRKNGKQVEAWGPEGVDFAKSFARFLKVARQLLKDEQEEFAEAVQVAAIRKIDATEATKKDTPVSPARGSKAPRGVDFSSAFAEFVEVSRKLMKDE